MGNEAVAVSIQECLEDLLAEFGEALREGREVPAFAPFVRRCPEDDRNELKSLMNVLVLTEQAVTSLRDAGDEPDNQDRVASPAGLPVRASEPA